MDDPLTLPRRMLSIGVSVEGTLRDEYGSRNYWIRSSFAYGLTDRLALVGMPAVGYAVLDDTPREDADARPAPLGLEVWGGIAGIGWSSTEKLIYIPVAGVRARKRIGRDLLFGVSASFEGYVSELFHDSTVTGSLDAQFQLTDRVALQAAAYGRERFSTLRPSESWDRRGLGMIFGASYRPRHWATLGVNLETEAVERRFTTGGPVPPGEPIPPRLTINSPWVVGRTWIRFHW